MLWVGGIVSSLFIMSLILSSASEFFSQYQHLTEYIWIFALYFLPMIGGVCIILYPSGRYQNLLPRLLAGNILGYIILMSNEGWSATVRASDKLGPNGGAGDISNWTELLVRTILPCILCVAYLTIEINNNIKGNRAFSIFAVKRALSIFFQGFFYSLYLGALFSDLAGDVLLGVNVPDNPGPVLHQVCSIHFTYVPIKETNKLVLCLMGGFGRIYPYSILMLAPLALFIGIFAQILWEEKPITHPV
jgi:hypothetical protein